MQNQLLFIGVTLDHLLLRIEQIIDAKIGVLPKSSKEKSEYLSRKEVANLLKISLQTLHDWSKSGIIKPYKIGTRVLYKECEVQEALEKVPSFKHKKGGMSYGH